MRFLPRHRRCAATPFEGPKTTSNLPDFCSILGSCRGKNGAGERNRTPDRLITNQLLYLLSYASQILCLSTTRESRIRPPRLEGAILDKELGGCNHLPEEKASLGATLDSRPYAAPDFRGCQGNPEITRLRPGAFPTQSRPGPLAAPAASASTQTGWG